MLVLKIIPLVTQPLFTATVCSGGANQPIGDHPTAQAVIKLWVTQETMSR